MQYKHTKLIRKTGCGWYITVQRNKRIKERQSFGQNMQSSPEGKSKHEDSDLEGFKKPKKEIEQQYSKTRFETVHKFQCWFWNKARSHNKHNAKHHDSQKATTNVIDLIEQTQTHC